MKIYYSGGLCIEKKDKFLVDTLRARLLSYHYVTAGNTKYYWDLRDVDGPRQLMLDSGAFSVWNKGKAVDFNSYLKYAVSTQDKWDVIIVLDQIPGSPGHKNVSLAERDHCAAISWDRYIAMQKAGIPADKLMAVYHQGEHPKWMKRMADRCPLVGISPANDRSPEEKRVWLNDTMDLACDAHGQPHTRYHGLAVTSPSLMLDYPWDSVDSATWAILPGNGGMMVPYYRGPGKFDFTRYHVVHTGKRSNKPDHINTMSAGVQEQIKQTLFEAGLIDSATTEIPDDRALRTRVTTWFFDNLEQLVSSRPRPWRRPSQHNLGLHMEGTEDDTTTDQQRANNKSSSSPRRRVAAVEDHSSLSFEENSFDTESDPLPF